MFQTHASKVLMQATAKVLLVSIIVSTFSGCSRRYWRQQADEQTYQAIAEKQTDERWLNPRMDLTPDARSRFYDPYDPDCTPLPPDDRAAHRFMHCADGLRGYERWHQFGDALSIENSHWLEPYQVLLSSGDPVEGHSQVTMPTVSLHDSVDLAYIHSREYQTAIENVYLEALTLTLERYRLGTRFQVGGNDSGVGGGLVQSAVKRNGLDTASIANGLGFTRLFPGGATLAVNVLNTLTWNGAGGTGSATRLAWSVTQPFLRDGGRSIIMEALTQAERALLYEVRTLARFRQTLFTRVTSAFLGILQQTQNITNLENNIRQLQEQIEVGSVRDNRIPSQVNEPLRAFPPDVEIPDSLRDSLSYDDQLKLLRWRGNMSDEQKSDLINLTKDGDYQEAVQQLIRWKEIRVSSLSVAELLTRLGNSQNQLENARRVLADRQDGFKFLLGLPPNIQMTIAQDLLRPFELIDPLIVDVERDLKDLALQQGPNLILATDGAPEENRQPPVFSELQQYVSDLSQLKDRIRKVGVDNVRRDFIPVRDLLQSTESELTHGNDGDRYFSNTTERDRVINDVARDTRLFRINEQDFERVSGLVDVLAKLLQSPDSTALFQSLDTDNDGRVGAAEVPTTWTHLPRAPKLQDGQTLSEAEVSGALRDAAMGLREELLQISQSLQVVQLGLRVETIAINKFSLPGRDDTPDIDEVVQIGLENRHDLMNARAIVTDRRREVEIAANALTSLMNVKADGTVDPDGGMNDGVNVTLEFKAPLDHVVQRNAYREAQVAYQQERRNYMAIEDRVKLEIRESWRQLKVSEQRLEIDRQIVRNAALQYDNAALRATSASQNNSFSLLNALDSVLDAQDSLVGDWITYETNRLNIYRDMGIMEVNAAGVWEDPFYLMNGGSSPITGSPEPPPASAELTPQLQLDQQQTDTARPALEQPE